GAAEDSHAFSPSLEAGDRIRERISTRFDILLATKDEEGYQVGFGSEETSETRVVEAEGGLPRRIERAFPKKLETRESTALSGMLTREGFAHGKTVLVERTGEEWKTELLGGPEEEELPDELRIRLEGETKLAHLRIFPSEAVAPGYGWEKTGPELAALVPTVPQGHVRQGKAEFEFKEVTKTDGAAVAVIEVTSFTLALDGGEDGVKMNLVGKGVIRISLAKGVILSLKLKGRVRLPGAAGTLPGEGSFEIEKKAVVTKA
ncbi:MAG: hypothetical protein ACYTFG_09340, partial [Planctomycetota bacterium]